MGDGRLKCFLECRKEACCFLHGDSAAGPRGTESGFKKRFLSINIPHARKESLIHEQRVDTRRSLFDDSYKLIASKLREGVRSESIRGMDGFSGSQEPRLSKPPLVVKAQAFPARKPDQQTCPGVRIGGMDNQLPGHPQMETDAPFIREFHPEIFPLSFEGLPGLTREHLLPARFLRAAH